MWIYSCYSIHLTYHTKTQLRVLFYIELRYTIVNTTNNLRVRILIWTMILTYPSHNNIQTLTCGCYSERGSWHGDEDVMNILELIILHNQLTIDRMNRLTTFMSNNHITCRILNLMNFFWNILVYHSLLLIESFHPCPLKWPSTYTSPLFIITLTFFYQTMDTSP